MACEADAKVFDIKDLLKRAAQTVCDSFHDAAADEDVADADADEGVADAAPTSPKRTRHQSSARR